MTLEVAAVGEAGLLGLAVDPQFLQNRFLYVAHSYRVGAFSLRNRLVRLREDVKGKGILDKVLIDDVAGASNHDGGRVKFGRRALFLLASNPGPGRCFLPACVVKPCIGSFSIPTIRARRKISSGIFPVSSAACEILSKDPINRFTCSPATAMAAVARRRPTTIGSFA
jgi:hypothetical protein